MAMTDPGVLTRVVVSGIAIEAVTVIAAEGVVVAAEAADEQESCWLTHSSSEKPGPENETQAVN
jgi:hypothetical protein